MTPEEMQAEADRLVESQRKHRGFVRGKNLEGKPCLRLGPYVPTAVAEARAQRILSLRRAAAKLD